MPKTRYFILLSLILSSCGSNASFSVTSETSNTPSIEESIQESIEPSIEESIEQSIEPSVEPKRTETNFHKEDYAGTPFDEPVSIESIFQSFQELYGTAYELKYTNYLMNITSDKPFSSYPEYQENFLEGLDHLEIMGIVNNFLNSQELSPLILSKTINFTFGVQGLAESRQKYPVLQGLFLMSEVFRNLYSGYLAHYYPKAGYQYDFTNFTFYPYKLVYEGNNFTFELFYSSYYLISQVVLTYEDTSFTYDVSYFSLEDTANTEEEVDKIIYYASLLARASKYGHTVNEAILRGNGKMYTPIYIDLENVIYEWTTFSYRSHYYIDYSYIYQNCTPYGPAYPYMNKIYQLEEDTLEVDREGSMVRPTLDVFKESFFQFFNTGLLKYSDFEYSYLYLSPENYKNIKTKYHVAPNIKCEISFIAYDDLEESMYSFECNEYGLVSKIIEKQVDRYDFELNCEYSLLEWSKY